MITCLQNVRSIEIRKVHDIHALKFHMYFVRTMECLQTMCFKLEMTLLNIFDSNNYSNLDIRRCADSYRIKCPSDSICRGSGLNSIFKI